MRHFSRSASASSSQGPDGTRLGWNAFHFIFSPTQKEAGRNRFRSPQESGCSLEIGALEKKNCEGRSLGLTTQSSSRRLLHGYSGVNGRPKSSSIHPTPLRKLSVEEGPAISSVQIRPRLPIFPAVVGEVNNTHETKKKGGEGS